MIKKKVLVASLFCCLSGMSFGMEFLSGSHCRERDLGFSVCCGTCDLLRVSSPDIAIIARDEGFPFHLRYLERFTDTEIEKRREEIYGDPQLLERVRILARSRYAALPIPKEETLFDNRYDILRDCIHQKPAE